MHGRVALLAFALTLATGNGASQPIPIRNPGFEIASGTWAADWTAPATLPAGVTARRDPAIVHSGAASVKVTHARPASFAAASSVVGLKVGQLYRLSGWIRTENAQADQTSRYPTAVSATLTMASFPFTNSSTVVGGSAGWTRSEVLFFATQQEDRIILHFGYNGTATGTAWFDDIMLEQVDDVTMMVPMETVRWFGPAFRYTDRGWTFVHIEGEPYERGYQYGNLLSREIAAYMEKLAIRANADNPAVGWGGMRVLADATMLRRYDPEYLEEMKGIADGGAKAGGVFQGRTFDLLDIVTLNSAVDLGQLSEGLNKSPHGLSGRSFRVEEDELNAAERLHKCSSFLANGPATRDGRIVFGQLFMWNGYTGVHWDILCDVVPAKGHRIVYETFPGGIHSGADFYINDAGIMIGETTVMQTPFNPDGEPQSSRIRKAAQYAESIDDVVNILTTKNNGLYTNDWLIGDVRANEIGILLLGTKKHKLWRSTNGDFPGGTTGFYWSVNNAKDPEVRKEYVSNPSNAPFDLVFSPWNRDLAFVDFYSRKKGSIDAIEAVNLLASSPINRPHACDGKVTTSAMAENLVFLAHYGKVTMREKMPERNSRLMPDLPGAIPHLSLGYSAISPVFITERLHALRAKELNAAATVKRTENLTGVQETYSFGKRSLWLNTVFPASEAENWFISGSAAYWNMLNALPENAPTAMPAMRDQLTEMNCRLLYTLAREGSVAPGAAGQRYDRYNSYVIPRIRGTFALHQLRLLLGNEAFAKTMNRIHSRFAAKTMTTAQFEAAAEEAGGKDASALILQWVKREDLPNPIVTASATKSGVGYRITIAVRQGGTPYRFITSVGVETAAERIWKTVKVMHAEEKIILDVTAKPERILFNPGNDIPVVRRNFIAFSNYFDDFTTSLIVYGTARHIEANHTAALRFQTVLADQFTETFAPLRQDAEVTADDIATHDLVVIGGAADNTLAATLAAELGIAVGKNMFRWQGETYGGADEGLSIAMPNPSNPAKSVYMLLGNSALQVYQMTKRPITLPSWAIWKGDQITEKGYHPAETMQVPLAIE